MLCLSVEVRGRVLLVSGVRGSVGMAWFRVAAVFALRAGRAHWVGPVVEIIYSWGFRLFELSEAGCCSKMESGQGWLFFPRCLFLVLSVCGFCVAARTGQG